MAFSRVCVLRKFESCVYNNQDQSQTTFDNVQKLLTSMNELVEAEGEASRTYVAKAQSELEVRESAARRTAERHQKMLNRIGIYR